MMKRLDVTVVGEIFADHIFTGFPQWPQPGEEVYASDYVRELGGGVAITACALARLGRKAAVVAVLGEGDTWSRRRLETFGVVTDGLMYSETRDTAVTVSVSTREDRSFFTWAGANVELPAALTRSEVREILLASRHVHFAMRLDRAPASALFPILREGGCTLSIDPGFHPEWSRRAENQQTFRECTYFFPNEKEGQLMSDSDQPEQILARLQQAGMHGTVLKMGRNGAIAGAAGQVLHASPPEMPVVDTTGAGDAFDAGFLDSILDDPSLLRALRRGCACGALSTRAAGALAALPDREEMEELYEHIQIEVSNAD